MALHTTAFIGVLLATVTLFTMAVCHVQFSSASYTVGEHDGYNITVEVCPDGNSENDTGSGSGLGTTDSTAVILTVYITSEGETASDGIDYISISLNQTVDLREQCVPVNISIWDDMVYEGNETFIITASYQSLTKNNTSTRITILDDDYLELEVLGNSTRTITEGTDYTLCLEMRLIQDIERNFSIRINTTMDTADESSDYVYTAAVSTIFTFGPSSVNITNGSTVEACVNINITDDSIGEPLEYFTVVVEPHEPSGRIRIINGEINITIQDDEIIQNIEPQNFSVTRVQSRNISFSWDRPDTNLTISGYTVNCSNGSSSQTTSSDDVMTTATVSDLEPFTNYSCFAFTRVNGNRGNSTEIVTQQTAEEVPGSPPRNVTVANKSSQELNLIWLPPELSYGIITSYNISFTNGTDIITRISNVTSLSISPFKPYQQVNVMISATNSMGSGPFSNETSFRTSETKSDPVSNLTAMSVGDRALNVIWTPPAQPNGEILNYSIVIYRVNIDCRDSNAVIHSREHTDNGNEFSKMLGDLDPMVPFLISVRAVNSVSESESMEVCAFTRQGTPMAPRGIMATRNTDDSVVVLWDNLTLTEARGWIVHYTVHYWDAGKQNRTTAHNFTTEGVQISHNFTSKDFDVFQTYNIVVTGSTVAGEGTDSQVFVLLGKPRPSPDSPQGSNTGVTAAAAVILLLIIVAITVTIIIVLIRFRRRVFRPRSDTLSMKPLTPPNNIELNSYHRYGSNNGHFDSPVHQASKDIPIEEFSDHVKELHRDSNRLFEHQYRSIKDAAYRHDAAFLPCNRDTKNRFIDIFPYDTNRVVLKKTGDEGSDYINASWINGYKRNNAYIAAQGPREETIEDFWRMISENRLPTIVMVTRLIEGPKMVEKCRRYWPDKVGHVMRLPRLNMMVELKESKLFADYTINTLILKQPQCSDLEITQFFFQGWPDHGVPQYATSLLGFLRHVRRKHPYTDVRPLLIHCSAGVGRTGTFITLDVMLQKIREEESVNVHSFVKELRKHRCQMVQTESQYVFIHDALNEYITCGDTEVAVGNLRIALNKLYNQDSAGFKKQFQLLSEVSRRPTSVDLDAANSELHQHKNRYPEKIPYKDSGVRLKPSGVIGGEYINATFINGYKCINSFVAAQTPLDSTVETFWRMVWEIKCQTIVLLCDVEKESSCVCFWPEKGSATYGKLKVTATSKPVEKNDTVTRKFEVSFDKQKTTTVSSEKLSVTLFHYMEWNEAGDQPSSKSILQLYSDVIRAQISTGNKPIIVACNDGCGRTGTFLSIYSQIERLKTEQVIDVFQWVKSVRIQRAWLVSNQEQYELIYEVLSEFIDSFDTYANFQVAGDDP